MTLVTLARLRQRVRHAPAAMSRCGAARLGRVLFNDPGIGVVRHADAGYESARAAARRLGIRMPMLDE